MSWWRTSLIEAKINTRLLHKGPRVHSAPSQPRKQRAALWQLAHRPRIASNTSHHNLPTSVPPPLPVNHIQKNQPFSPVPPPTAGKATMVELHSRAAGPGFPDKTKAFRAAALDHPADSGPMLESEESMSLDEIPDIPFAQLCHDGRALTAKNWLVKLWRYTIVPTKELYLPWMFSGMPTNYLMVGALLLLAGRLARWLVGWLAGWLVGWLVGCGSDGGMHSQRLVAGSAGGAQETACRAAIWSLICCLFQRQQVAGSCLPLLFDANRAPPTPFSPLQNRPPQQPSPPPPSTHTPNPQSSPTAPSTATLGSPTATMTTSRPY